MNKPPRIRALLIAGLYVFVSLVWIFSSDRLLLFLVRDPVLLTGIQSIKGVSFVVLSGALIFWLMAKEFIQLQRYADDLKQSQVDHQNIVNTSQEGIWTTDREGRITLANLALCGMLGYPLLEILHKPLGQFVRRSPAEPLEWPPPVTDPHLRAELCLMGSNDTPVWVIASISYQFSPEGELLGSTGLTVDITARKAIEKALQDSESRYRNLFENSPIGLWEEDYTAVKQYIDGLKSRGIEDFPAFLEMHPEVVQNCISKILVRNTNQEVVRQYRARSKEDLLGNLDKLIGDEGYEMVKREILAIAAGATEFDEEGVNYRLDGQRIDIRMRWSVPPGYEKTMGNVLVSSSDISDQLRAEEQLKSAEVRYRTLVEQITAVIYVDKVDDASTTLYISPQIEDVTGYTVEEWTGDPSLWIGRLYPEDLERVLEEHQRSNREGGGFEIEYRWIRKDGRVVWLHDTAALRWDNYHHDVVWQGVLFDVTERKQAELALYQSEMRFRLLLQTQGEGTILFDHQGRIEYANPAAENLFGLEPDLLVNRFLVEFMLPENADKLFKVVQNLVPGSSETLELPVWTVEQQARVLLVTVTPTYGASIQAGGGLATCRDITERKQVETKLRYQSTHDALTGLYNRSYFEEYLAQLGKDSELPISLLVLDVDGLKKVNDTLGHAKGDELLRRVARVLKGACRGMDVVARIGGDEFSVLLPRTESESANMVVERINFHLADANTHSPDLTLVLSIGAATSCKMEEITTIFHRADQAMYQQKQEKRLTKGLDV